MQRLERLRTSPIWPWLKGLAIIAMLIAAYMITYMIVDATDAWKFIYKAGDCLETCAHVWMPVLIMSVAAFGVVVIFAAVVCMQATCIQLRDDIRATREYLARDTATVEMV